MRVGRGRGWLAWRWPPAWPWRRCRPRPGRRRLAGSAGGGAAQAPGCVPVPAAECGSVRVPLFRSRPAGPMIDIGYALIRHRDPALPAARGTVVLNPGGPGGDVISGAAEWTEQLAGLLGDHDLLLIDPRGTGRSHPISCGVTGLPATRQRYVRAIGRCGRRLGRQARAYTSAATADDFEAVRAHLGIPKLDLCGVSYGTYLMTVFAQRHPSSVRSIVLSSAFPLRFDMWARANARAVRLAIRRVCARSTTGSCDGARTLRQLGRLARRLRANPIRYQVDGERRLLDETALAGIAYGADVNIGQLPAIVRAALRGDTGPLIAAARALSPMSGSQAPGGPPDLALAVAILCNDYPTLWDRSRPIPVRLRQFEARRARLDQIALPAVHGSAHGRARSSTAATAASAGPTGTGRCSAPRGRSPTCRCWSPRATLTRTCRPRRGAWRRGSSSTRKSSRCPTPGTCPSRRRPAARCRSPPTSSATSGSATPAAWQDPARAGRLSTAPSGQRRDDLLNRLRWPATNPDQNDPRLDRHGEERLPQDDESAARTRLAYERR